MAGTIGNPAGPELALEGGLSPGPGGHWAGVEGRHPDPQPPKSSCLLSTEWPAGALEAGGWEAERRPLPLLHPHPAWGLGMASELSQVAAIRASPRACRGSLSLPPPPAELCSQVTSSR